MKHEIRRQRYLKVSPFLVLAVCFCVYYFFFHVLIDEAVWYWLAFIFFFLSFVSATASVTAVVATEADHNVSMEQLKYVAGTCHEAFEECMNNPGCRRWGLNAALLILVQQRGAGEGFVLSYVMQEMINNLALLPINILCFSFLRLQIFKSKLVFPFHILFSSVFLSFCDFNFTKARVHQYRRSFIYLFLLILHNFSKTRINKSS